MKTLTIKLEPTYPIYFIQHLLHDETLANFLQQKKLRLAIVSDSNLENTLAAEVLNYLHKHNLSAEVLTFPAGEAHKTRETKQQLEDQLLAKQFTRDTCLIAVGGGVTIDLTGFLAATFCRGVDVIYIPTSLLAMADASIGGKTAVNTPYGKNLIGCFYQPQAVFIDTGFLKTLPKAEFKNGMAEILKHLLIMTRHEGDNVALASMKTSGIFNVWSCAKTEDIAQLIYQSCLIKKNIVEQDEKEQSLRALLNFGHTIGHGIEILENYRIRHGEAVAIGILMESYLSLQMGFLSKVEFDKILTLVESLDLPLETQAFNDRQKFKAALALDKKSAAQQVRFVLLDAIGVAHVENGSYAMPVPKEKLDEALDWFKIYSEKKS